MAVLAVLDVNATEQQLAVAMGLIGFMVTIIASVCIIVLQQYGRVKQAWMAATENTRTLHDVVIPQLNTIRTNNEQAHKDIITAVEGKNGNGTATHSTAK